MKENDFVEDASDIDAKIQAVKALEGKMKKWRVFFGSKLGQVRLYEDPDNSLSGV